MENSIDELIYYLKNVPEGKVLEKEGNHIIDLLVQCWDFLEGSDETSMAPHKLNRYENLTFTPPATLEFDIERHGAVAFGSIYAEIQHWSVDLEKKEASCSDRYSDKKRMIGKRDKVLKVTPLAMRIVDQILNLDKTSLYLSWKSDDQVRVKISEIIPTTNKQTTADRRKRFRKKVEELLLLQGWSKMPAYNVYSRLQK